MASSARFRILAPAVALYLLLASPGLALSVEAALAEEQGRSGAGSDACGVEHATAEGAGEGEPSALLQRKVSGHSDQAAVALDPCACSSGKRSGNVTTKYKGCKDHLGDGRWCYVTGGANGCPQASPSTAHPGAAWMACESEAAQCAGSPTQTCRKECTKGAYCPEGMCATRTDTCCSFLCMEAKRTCPGDLEWNECGSACPLECGKETKCFTKQCVRGCFCPPGMYKVGDSCVPKSKCLQGKEVDPCSCTMDGLSGSLDTGMIGCKNWFGNGAFCYVSGGIDQCPQASESKKFPGTAWIDCEIGADMCFQSKPQMCRMFCPQTYCPEGMCAERVGNCCEFRCSFTMMEGRPLTLAGRVLLASPSAMPASATDDWGHGSSDLGAAPHDAQSRSGGLAASLLQDALRSGGWAADPFPELTGTVALEPRLAEVLLLAQAEIAATDASEREHWYSAGLAEHASVGSFAKLCLELLVMGAPPRLLRRAIKAQEEELLHAHIALGLFSADAKTATITDDAAEGPAGMQLNFPEHSIEVKRDQAAIRAAAVEEGLLGEGRAALRLFGRSLNALGSEAGATTASAGRRALAEVVWAMAQDEARHAAMAMEIVEWLETSTAKPPPLVEISAGAVNVKEI